MSNVNLKHIMLKLDPNANLIVGINTIDKLIRTTIEVQLMEKPNFQKCIRKQFKIKQIFKN